MNKQQEYQKSYKAAHKEEAFLPCNHQWLSCKQNFIKARNDRKKSKWQD